jgi:hypothetical protein
LYRHRAELLARRQGAPPPATQPGGAGISVSGNSTLVEAAPAMEF